MLNLLEGRPYQSGWIEVICGPMFSGKTNELIRRITRVSLSGQHTLVVKPEIDTRSDKQVIVSHDQARVDAISLKHSRMILEKAEAYQVVAIDEAQFFDASLPTVADRLADQGKRVLISGLDMDYKGLPFEPMPRLMAGAEIVDKLSAICQVCGSTAPYTFRLAASQARVVIGAGESYEPRCRTHFVEGMQSNQNQGELF